MGSRRSSLPPNFDRLDDEGRKLIEEECCRFGLRDVHGLGPGDPLLKSREKIK